jgi:hypothetical protein
MPSLKYNERSWAIDVITEINIYCAARPAFNIHAKGELGLKSSTTTLFPDVLLFGTNVVTQGWELKMPDTDINDLELLKNAEKKADTLRLNSFLVWNGKDAALYCKNEESEKFSCIKNWSRPSLANRAEMERLRSIWISMLHEILIDLEVFLKNGILRPQAGIDVLDETFITRVIESVFKSDSSSIQAKALTDETLRRDITSWRLTFYIAEEDQFNELARLNILCWVNRFIFCHYLSRYNSIAAEIQGIDSDWTIEKVYELFRSISSTMDFANVFVPGIADSVMSNDGWMARIAFNHLLTEIRIADIPESSLRKVLDTFSLTSQRKSFGQYSTPPLLAQAIAFIALNDLTKDAWDPCCGSGTIAKALYQTKVEEGVDRQDALASVWASDKFQMPLQLTSMRLSDPLAIESVIQVFQSDVLDVRTDQEIRLTNPKDPKVMLQKNFPKMSAIASNLPFVSFNDLYASTTTNFAQILNDEQDIKLTEMKRADIYAIITLALNRHLSDSGRMVLIVSNSWIATEWGMKWQNIICKTFRLVSVIKSGNGRWFQNSDVESTILVLEKRSFPIEVNPNEQINFVTTNLELSNWTSEFIEHLKDAALEGVNHSFLSVASHNLRAINTRRSAGYSWRANFHCGVWLEDLISKTIRASSYLDIARGSRRGQDDLFILSANQTHGIEIDFLVPMLKTSSGQKELIARPSHYAFCCNRSLEELKVNGFDGAISWIESFSEKRNSKGKPLKEVLATSKLDWFQMEPDEIGDFAISMNPDASLVVFRTLDKCFMNQRLIRMNTIQGDPSLIHALLNCCVAMLNIEFLGFGRGLGVLDLSSDRLKNYLHLLDPKLINQKQIDSIKESFTPLLNRPFENLVDELQLSDRQEFDRTVLSCWGLESIQFDIYEALTEAVHERRNAHQSALRI